MEKNYLNPFEGKKIRDVPRNYQTERTIERELIEENSKSILNEFLAYKEAAQNILNSHLF